MFLLGGFALQMIELRSAWIVSASSVVIPVNVVSILAIKSIVDLIPDTHSHTLPDDGRSISRNVAEKHYDSRPDKLRNNMDTTESTNTNIFKTVNACLQ